MTMPGWWNERRFGLFVHATPASVPGWAPIGADAADYRRFLGEAAGSSTLGEPLVEVLAHHRDRWGHVDDFDDFVPLLTYEHFDAEDWARLASEAGANYSIVVAKHDDGWTWWDAPGSTRPLTEDGPHRDVLSEYAAACERHGLAFGTSYSLVDGDAAATQVADLVERRGTMMLCGSGLVDRGNDGRGAPDASALAGLLGRVQAVDADLVVDDGWPVPTGATHDGPRTVQTFRDRPPDDVVRNPWQLVRGLGPSLGYNRAERDEHRLNGRDIIALYTEVMSKGGNLLLAVGPDADGVIPSSQADPLRQAGRWIGRYGPLLAGSTPWDVWGDDSTRYMVHDGDVLAVDVGGDGTLTAIPSAVWKVHSVESIGEPDAVIDWHQDEDGLHVDRSPAGSDGDGFDISVFRISLEPADRPDELFASSMPMPIPLAPLLADASPGTIVQLGDGVYEGPVEVPPNVVVRGLGSDRTTIAVALDAAPDGHRPTIDVGKRARIEHVHVAGVGATVVTVAGNEATMLGCRVTGVVEVRADDVLLRAVQARGFVGINADRLHVSRCDLTGRGDDVGIDLRRGGGQHIDSNRLSGHRSAIRLTETTGSNVRGNTIAARWCGVHLDHCESAHVHGNRITRTMRAVHVDGGTQAVVDGNAVTDGDSGCLVEDGASDCEVYGNHWDRCRIGLLAWEAVALHHQDNIASSLHEPDGALVTGP